MEAILNKDAEDVKKMADDFEMFRMEHKAGQHKDGNIPFCESCEEERDNHDCKLKEKGFCQCRPINSYKSSYEKIIPKEDFFSTAGRDALRGLDKCTTQELQEDIRNNPFE